MRWQVTLGTLATASMLLLGNSSAQAHTNPAPNPLFRWPYPQIGFHGEADLIRALQWIGNEFASTHPYHLGARRAEVLVKRANLVLCSPVARNETLVAIGHLRNYRLTDRVAYLSAAARSVRRALEVEHRCHARPAPVPPVVNPPVVAPTPPVVNPPVVLPAPGPVVVPVRPATNIFFGGKHWGVSLQF